MLVPVPLALPVPFRSCRILFEQLCPVTRMLGPPLLSAVQASLPIHGVVGDLPSMVIATALPLAGWITARGLSRLELGGMK